MNPPRAGQRQAVRPRTQASQDLGAKDRTHRAGGLASSPILVRAEGNYAFPADYRRVMGFNELGIWVDDERGSTGLLRPSVGLPVTRLAK